MAQVDFYILSSASAPAYLGFCVRLLNKAVQQAQTSFVFSPDAALRQQLDELLWTFDDRSFVPHQTDTDSIHPDCPIYLGKQLPELHFDILVNLDQAVPSFYNQFDRVIEIVDNRDTHKAQGRERFKFYRQHGCQPNTHTING